MKTTKKKNQQETKIQETKSKLNENVKLIETFKLIPDRG